MELTSEQTEPMTDPYDAFDSWMVDHGYNIDAMDAAEAIAAAHVYGAWDSKTEPTLPGLE